MASKKSVMIAAGAMLAAAGAAQASFLGSERYDGCVELQSTDWSESIEVPQFDTRDGRRELVSICISITGEVTGSARAESRDAQPATVMVNLKAEIALSLAGDDLAVVIPIANESFKASEFDGETDFGGTSGMTFEELSGMDGEMAKVSPMDENFDAFVGDGFVKLDASAMGMSFGSGAGNLVLQFNTSAGLKWEVEYKWIPTPGALALAGMAGVTGLRRRR